jgi:hypothetical protein
MRHAALFCKQALLRWFGRPVTLARRLGYFDIKPPTEPQPTHSTLWRILEITLIVIIIALLAGLWLPIWLGRNIH